MSTNTIGNLVVQLGLNPADYMAGLKKAQAETSQQVSTFQTQFASLKSSIAGLAIGGTAVAAMSSALNFTRDYANEVDKLARLSGTSNQEFQKQAYAANTVGVSMEKLSDIYKDVQDKVGDFMATGGGEMKDFFEKVAPKVGVTADQFARLSGPEALQLYVSSLQKAGLSQSEMVFYLEAIANDATLLLPLLQSNGKAMRDLGDEAQRLGKVLDDDAIRAGKEFDTNIKQLTSQLDALKLMVGNSVIPEVNRLTKEFLAGMDAAGGFWGAVNLGLRQNPFKSLDENLASAKAKLAELEAIQRRAGNGDGTFESNSQIAYNDAEIKSLKQEITYYQRLRNEQRSYSPNDQSSAEARRLGLIGPTATAPPPPPPKPGKAGKGTKSDKDPAIQAAADREEEMQALLRDRLGVIKELEGAGKALYEATRTPIEQLNIAEAQYKSLLDKRYIDEETYWRAREAAQDTYVSSLDTVKAVVVEASKEAEEQARRMGDAYASTFSQALQNGMKFGDLLKKLAIDGLSIKFLTPAATRAGDFLSAGVSKLFSSFDGGGYTGNGSRSGGMDGKGGYLALLHPQETVIDHTRGQGVTLAGGGTSVTQHITIDARGADAGVENRIRAAMDQVRREIVPTVVRAANSGGSTARALGRT